MRITLLAITGLFFLVSCSNNRSLSDLSDVIVIEMDTVEIVPEVKFYRPTEKKVHDLLHTRLDVSFDWGNQYLNGTATLKLKPWFYSSDRLILDAKGMDIHSVQLIDSTLSDLSYTYDSLYLDIQLPRKYARFETYEVKIEYTAKPEELNVEGSDAITDAKGLYFINPDSSEVGKPTQIWTQGQTEASSCWFPTIDTPAERMTQELYITTHKDFVTLSNGTLVYTNFNADDTRTDYWKMEQEHPPYLAMMAVGNFVIANDSWTNSEGETIPVQYFLEPEYSSYAYQIFGNTPEMMEFYSNLLDYDYPWDKYAQIVVRDYVSGAMENTTAVIHGDFVQGTTRELIDYDAEDVIAHELFHHWFGDLVTCESWSHLPLNESFATYGEVLWEEYKYGKDAGDFHAWESDQGYFYESQYKQLPLIRFDYNDKEDMFDSHSYNKGGAILGMLRSVVGDTAFFASLNHYLKENAFKDAETDNLRIAFEEVTGLDLNWFFDQWFFGAGHPSLEVSYFWDAEKKEQQVVVMQTQRLTSPHPTPQESIFRIPTQIALHDHDGNVRIEEVVVENAEHLFRFACDEEPSLVRFDPEEEILCFENQNMDAQWWNQLIDPSLPFRTRYEAVQYANRNPSERYNIIESALLDPFWYIRKEAVVAIVDADTLSQLAQTRLIQMLDKEEESDVLRDVIFTLSVMSPDDLSEAYLINCIDKSLSYRVNAAGLRALSAKNYDLALQKADELAQNLSPQLIDVIAEVYAESGDETKVEFFERAFYNYAPEYSYGALQHYRDFIAELPLSASERALDNVEKIDANPGVWWLNIANYRLLNSIVYRNSTSLGPEPIFTNEVGERAFALHKKYWDKAKGERSELINTLSELKSK